MVVVVAVAGTSSIATAQGDQVQDVGCGMGSQP